MGYVRDTVRELKELENIKKLMKTWKNENRIKKDNIKVQRDMYLAIDILESTQNFIYQQDTQSLPPLDSQNHEDILANLKHTQERLNKWKIFRRNGGAIQRDMDLAIEVLETTCNFINQNVH